MGEVINIIHIVFNLEFGGLEKLAIDLASAISGQNFKSSICCLNGLGDMAHQAQQKGIEVLLAHKKSGVDVGVILRLARLLKEKKVSLVHTHNMGPLLYGTLASRLAGVPVVVNTRHGREKKSCHSFIWKMNDVLVAVSEDAKEQMLKSNRIDEDKVKVIYNGIDISKFDTPCDRAKDMAIKKEYGIPEDALVIGCVGRLASEKDHRTLLMAYKNLIKKYENLFLIIAGDGMLKRELEEIAYEENIDKKVKFLGFILDIPKILSICDVFALPSLTEGVSLTLLEAMAAAKPVVATNVGGNSEVIVNGKTGFLVPAQAPEKMAQALDRIFSNRELAYSMGEAGRRRVEQTFSSASMVDEYRKLYKSLLTKKGFL